MIIGKYPCCNNLLCIQEPRKTPAYLPENCPHCGEKVWHVLSRIDPISYVEKEFLEEYEINYEKREVRKRNERK